MGDLNGQTSQSDDSAYEIPEPTMSELEQVHELLYPKDQKNPEKEPEPAPGREPDAAKASEETPAEEAPETEEPDAEAESDADKKAFYAKEFTLNDGTVWTVGEAKDLAQEYQSKTVELIERENQVNARHYQLQRMTQYMNLTPDQLAEANEQNRQQLTREFQNMMTAIPEFKDPIRYEKARTDMYADLRPYGFSDAEIAQMADHRLVKYVYDTTRMRQGLKSAKDSVKRIRTPEPKAKTPIPANRTSALSQATDTAKRTGNIADQMKAVDLLLRG
jgi:hypothetical protein